MQDCQNSFLSVTLVNLDYPVEPNYPQPHPTPDAFDTPVGSNHLTKLKKIDGIAGLTPKFQPNGARQGLQGRHSIAGNWPGPHFQALPTVALRAVLFTWINHETHIPSFVTAQAYPRFFPRPHENQWRACRLSMRAVTRVASSLRSKPAAAPRPAGRMLPALRVDAATSSSCGTPCIAPEYASASRTACCQGLCSL